MSKKLSDVAEVIDSLHATPEYTEDGYSMVRVVDINNSFLHLDKCFKVDKETCDKHNKNHIPKKGDIIITRVGSYGMMAFVDTDEEFCLGQNIAIISPKTNSKYLYYYLQSPYMQSIIYGKSGGSSYKCIGLEDIRNFPFESNGVNCEKVGELLYEIDAKIENNNKINAELESMAKTIYDYWFLQFEFPNEEGKPYKSSGGEMVWNDILKRNIPKGWNVASLFEACDVIYGYPLSTEQFTEKEGQPVIRIRDIVEGSISAYTTEGVDEKFYTCEKDLLIGMDGNFHMNFWSRKNDIVNQRIVRVRDRLNVVSVLQVFFEVMPFIKAKEQNVARSTVGHLSDKDMKSLYILIPDNTYIYKHFDDILNRLCLLMRENQQLSEVRDFILPMLMNGQIGFKEAEYAD